MTTSASNTHTAAAAIANTPTAVRSANAPPTIPQQQQQQTTAASPTAAAVAAAAAATRTMQSDEDFNIRFVNLVRTHKCLYDKKVPEYRNRDNQEKAWSLISQETRESVIHCKERWRNLRACLSRYIKQQNGSDPQHKPYYLTEHMAFLLPFLKSTRNSLDGNANNSLATLFHFSQQQQLAQLPGIGGAATSIHVKFQPQLQFNGDALQQHQQLELKHSLSDNEDEETIDAFDPAITAGLQQQMQQRLNGVHSPPLSDTASANTLQNFIPDVQLAELRTPDATQVADMAAYVASTQHNQRDARDFAVAHEPATSTAKRIKTECHASEATTTAQLQLYSGEHADMEFFRSILPDIASLTPQQKRKFKIGILELIDGVVERYPSSSERSVAASNSSSGAKRRNSAREWRK